MAKRYWETLLKDKDENASTPWWLKIIFGVGFLLGIGFSILIIVPVFLLTGWCFSLLWNYTVSPIFNVMEITSYMGAALLALIFCSIRLLKFAFRN